MANCECGCGTLISGNARNGPKRFVSGHNLIGQEKTAEHCRRISEGARRAWSTKRKRVPVGTKKLNVHGYVIVKMAEQGSAWTKEHRLVMEASVGRPLQRHESVHHINGIRDDNRLENLYLCRNNRHHMQVEHSMAIAFRVLMEQGLARFNPRTGEYEAFLL